MANLVDRRSVLLGGLLTVIGAVSPTSRCRGATEEGTGCWIPSNEVSGYFARSSGAMLFGAGGETLQTHSGNRELDYALAQSLGMIARTFDVLPAFAFYEDGEGRENARATPERLLKNADGTVLFGLVLLRELLSRPDGDASVVAVCAHEFGHIVSYKNGDISQLAPTQSQPFRAEQYADFMSGYFAGRRKLERPDFPAVVFATTCRSFGGGDHGTGVQRGEAVQEGFLTAYRDRRDTKNGIAAALQFAMSRSL